MTVRQPIRERVTGTDPHSRAVRAYVSGGGIRFGAGTRAEDLQAADEWEAMWRKRYARDARRAKSRKSLRERYLNLIWNSAADTARELFGDRVAVSIQYGDSNVLAWLGGDSAVIWFNGRTGPRALREELLRQAGRTPRVDRGLTQSLNHLVRK